MLLIYLPVITPRSEYIFEYIFKNEFGIHYCLTTDLQYFKDYQQEKINYSESRMGTELYIQAKNILSENYIKGFEPPINEKNNIKVLFGNDEPCDIGFDVFSATFYMISRYEEYLPFTPDIYGRFKATESLAYKNNFLQIPVVDHWLIILKNILIKKFPSLLFRKKEFKVITTYDIDVAYKFKGRSVGRNIGSTIKDLASLHISNIQSRLETLFKKKKDPWDVYGYLEKIIVQNKINSIFFFLLGDSSKHDRNLDYTTPLIKNLINTIKTFSEIGIHPSFTTSILTAKIAIEKDRLEKICNKTITKSRQHYLKFSLPSTYNALLKAGITEDYSMGFPEAAGFRAGTSTPFYFYDLKNEKATSLQVFPVSFMDGSYINSIKTKEEIIEDIYKLIEEVKNVNGMFLSIWHNHTVSDTKEFIEWKNIHDKMIEQVIF